MKKLFTSIFLALLVLSVSAQYSVQTVPNPRSTDAAAFVANPDGILRVSDVKTITDIATAVYKAVGVEMVTVVVKSIGDEVAFDFAYELFNQWGIGDKEKNRGVLLFFALDSRDIQIITGGGMEGLLPDAICSDIVYNSIIPPCKEGEYGNGLIAGNKAVFETLMTDAAKAELLLGWKAKPVSESPFGFLSFISLMVLIIAVLRYFMQPKCPQCGKRGCKTEKEVLVRETYTSDGVGQATFTCLHCGNIWKKEYTISRTYSSSSSSHTSSGGSSYGGGYGSYRGGGGSFGGGRSFGGGAGGKF